MPLHQSVQHLYHSSPDFPAISSREVRRAPLLSNLVDAWRSGHRILGLHGARGVGKTIASIQAAASPYASGTNHPPSERHRTLWLELRICPDAGGILSQLSDCVYDMGFTAVAQQLREQAQPNPILLANALVEVLGADCLIIVDQCETVLNDQGRIADPYLGELLQALLGQTGWRALLTVCAEDAPPTDLLAETHASRQGGKRHQVQWFLVEELSYNERIALLHNVLATRPFRWDNLPTETQHLILTEIAGHPLAFALFLADPGDDPAATVQEIQRRAKDLVGAAANTYAALDYYLERIPTTVRPMLDLLVALEDREPWPFLEGAWKALGSILGWPLKQAESALTELVQHAFIEKGDGGYRVLPMVRHRLLSRAAPFGFSESLARVLHFHLARLYEALAKQVKEQTQGLLAAGKSNEPSPQVVELMRYHAVLRDRALRQALRRNTLRLVRCALEGLLEPPPWRLTTQLGAGRCFAYTRRLAVRIEQVISHPSEENPPNEVGACYHAIGLVCEAIGEADQAIKAFQGALCWWEHTRQPYRMGTELDKIGRIYARQQRWQEALVAYRSALDRWERTRQYKQMGGVWHRIGGLYANQGKWPEALSAYHTALEWQGRTNRQSESGSTWQQIGEVHEVCANVGSAAQAYIKALESLQHHSSGSTKMLKSVSVSARRLLAASPAGDGQGMEGELARLRGIIQMLPSSR